MRRRTSSPPLPPPVPQQQCVENDHSCSGEDGVFGRRECSRQEHCPRFLFVLVCPSSPCLFSLTAFFFSLAKHRYATTPDPDAYAHISLTSGNDTCCGGASFFKDVP